MVSEMYAPQVARAGLVVELTDGKRIVVKLDEQAMLRMTARVRESEISLFPVTYQHAEVIGYDVELTGLASGFTMWEGGMPGFDAEVEQERRPIDLPASRAIER